MTSTVHRVLMTLSAILTGLGGLVAVPDFTPLGIPAEVGLGMVFAGSAATIFATAIRANFPTETTPTPPTD